MSVAIFPRSRDTDEPLSDGRDSDECILDCRLLTEEYQFFDPSKGKVGDKHPLHWAAH